MEDCCWISSCTNNNYINYCLGGDDMNSHLKLKNKLKEFRQKAGLTQTQLAEMVGSSKNTISSIETSQFCPTAYLAALLCIALDCKFEDLFYFDEE